jgi:hypothetical protein
MAAIVTPKTCPKCQGTGFVNSGVRHYGVPGACFKCDGGGVVESNKNALALAKFKKAYLLDRGQKRVAFAHAARAWDKANGARRYFEDGSAVLGLDLLEMQQPERFAKALDSFLAGRQDVFPALVTWLLAEAKPTH